jgi:DNA-binding MarR family transcriptional regulator
MADPHSAVNPSPGAAAKHDELRQSIELLFYAYRDFTAEPDVILEKIGLGRAHHRVVYFVGRHPQITVAELLSILRITKQSLARVLSDVVRLGYVAQKPGTKDRRQRLLELTASGQALERQLSETQRQRFARAYRQVGPGAAAAFRAVLLAMMDEAGRRQVTEGMPSPRRRG